MKLYAVSDTHVDYKENREWCEGISDTEHQQDAIIIAGDVSHDIAKIEESLLMFKRKFSVVFYVPGNHELWVRNAQPSMITSIDKFEQIISMCKRIGVITTPNKIGTNKKVWVVPMFAWYHESLDKNNEDDDYEEDKLKEAMKGWSDFLMCKWPANFLNHSLNPHAPQKPSSYQTVTPKDYFLNLNKPNLHPYDAPVISFSHFVPRRDLLPPKEFLFIPFLPKVSGAAELDVQLRSINSTMHVFGHTHCQYHNTKDGVYYVQNALSYPRERKLFKFPSNISQLKIWDENDTEAK